jgi:hypothetical protein
MVVTLIPLRADEEKVPTACLVESHSAHRWEQSPELDART